MRLNDNILIDCKNAPAGVAPPIFLGPDSEILSQILSQLWIVTTWRPIQQAHTRAKGHLQLNSDCVPFLLILFTSFMMEFSNVSSGDFSTPYEKPSDSQNEVQKLRPRRGYLTSEDRRPSYEKACKCCRTQRRGQSKLMLNIWYRKQFCKDNVLRPTISGFEILFIPSFASTLIGYTMKHACLRFSAASRFFGRKCCVFFRYAIGNMSWARERQSMPYQLSVVSFCYSRVKPICSNLQLSNNSKAF